MSYGLAGSIGAFVVGGLYLLLSAVGLVLVAVWLVNLVLAVVLVGTVDVLSVLLLVLAVGVVVTTRRPEVRAFAA
ncbi:hypothetical protein GCM10023162_23720 [Klenkia terrae]